MNHLEREKKLKNRYFAMRHGQSKANYRNIIVSSIENDRRGSYGLSDLGRKQALISARDSGLPVGTVIYSSDFSRAEQTAKIVREQLEAPAVHVAEALRERYFGDWEGSSTGNYELVWAADKLDADHGDNNVEPASAVLGRATALIIKLEAVYSDNDILLVSHGDTLQILQAAFRKMGPAEHRSIPHLKTAEIRLLHLSP
jgi:glucosyl-3-phosphoglycerate phosphatase